MARLRVLLMAMLVLALPANAALAIDSIEPLSIVFDPGDTAMIVVTSTVNGGSCFTVGGDDPDLQVEVVPQCSTGDGPTTFTVTITASADVALGAHQVTIQEFDPALESPLDRATVVVTVSGGAASEVTSTTSPAGTTSTLADQGTVATTEGPATTPPITAATTAAAADPGLASVDATTLGPVATPANGDDAGSPGSDTALWILVLVGAVSVGASFAWWASRQPGSGEIRFRGLSRGTSFSGLAGVFQPNRDDVARVLMRLAANPRQLTMQFSQLSEPDAPLRCSIRFGRFDRNPISLVVSPSGSDAVVLAGHRDAVSRVEVSRPELRHILGHLVDDLAASGDPESAAALHRWLG